MFEKVPDILTVKECQQLLKIGKNSMLNFLHTGEMEGFKIGNQWRIYKESVIDFIRRR
jgi:excisionase family DNA binding protein